MLIELTLDIEKGSNRFSTLDNPITLRQQDAEAYVFSVTIRQGGQKLDLTGKTVRYYALKPDGTSVIDGQNVTVSSAADGTVQYPIPKALTNAAGDIPTSYFRITSDTWSASTQNVAIKVIPSVGVEVSQESGGYIPELDAILNKMEAQRVSYSNAEETHENDWSLLTESVQQATQKALTSANDADGATSAALGAATDARTETSEAEDAAVLARAAADYAMNAARSSVSCGCEPKLDLFAQMFVALTNDWLVIGQTAYARSSATVTSGVLETINMAVSGTAAILTAYDGPMGVTARFVSIIRSIVSLGERSDEIYGMATQAQLSADTAQANLSAHIGSIVPREEPEPCDCRPDLLSLAEQLSNLAGWSYAAGTIFGTSGKASYASDAMTISASMSGTTAALV